MFIGRKPVENSSTFNQNKLILLITDQQKHNSKIPLEFRTA